MLYAKLGNKQFKINKDEEAGLLKKGYTILEFVDGKKKREVKPVNVKDLAKENAKLAKEVKDLKAKITELTK